MDKHLIFLDIDGTLIDSSYQPNDSSLPPLIHRIQDSGKAVFALNSNRSLEDILPIADLFGIKGALVCENGLFVYFPEKKEVVNLADNEHLNDLSNLKENIFKWTRERYDLFNAPVKWLAEGQDRETLTHKEGSVLIKPVNSRKYTVSMHFRKVANGEIIPYREGMILLADWLIKNITSLGLEEDVVIRKSDSHPSVLVYSKKYTKHDGARYLQDNIYPNTKVIAIGNDPDDFEMVRDNGEFWAVRNSKPSALPLASKVATREYTKGVIELLENYFINA